MSTWRADEVAATSGKLEIRACALSLSRIIWGCAGFDFDAVFADAACNGGSEHSIAVATPAQNNDVRDEDDVKEVMFSACAVRAAMKWL